MIQGFWHPFLAESRKDLLKLFVRDSATRADESLARIWTERLKMGSLGRRRIGTRPSASGQGKVNSSSLLLGSHFPLQSARFIPRSIVLFVQPRAAMFERA